MIQTAVGEVARAELRPSTMRVALLLLEQASDDGQVNLTWDEFLAIAGCASQAGGRRHLTELSQAGIIHYSTNEYVYVTFRAFLVAPKPARQRAIRMRAHAQVSEGETVDCAQEPSEPARQRAIRMRVGAQVSDTQHVCMSVITDPPIANDELTDRQTAAVALLTDVDVGVDLATAVSLATEHEFEALRRHVFAYRRDREAGKVVSVGALLNRIRNNWGATVTAGDRTSDLWRRHQPPGEEARRYFPPEYQGIIRG